MKARTILLLGLCGLVGAPAVRAGGPDSGLFFGGSVNLQWVPGTGTWAGAEFKIDEPLSDGVGQPVGLAWSEHLLLGLKPVVGWKLNEQWALQATYGLNIPKSSSQTYSESNGSVYYDQGLTVEWKQRNLEIVGVYYPDADLDYYLFGGVDLTRIRADVHLFEGIQYEDYIGEMVYDGLYQEETDDITATGFLFGGGVELTSDSKRRVVYFSAQYNLTRTAGTFFGSEDFKVDVGGISFQAGLKLFPFHH